MVERFIPGEKGRTLHISSPLLKAGQHAPIQKALNDRFGDGAVICDLADET